MVLHGTILHNSANVLGVVLESVLPPALMGIKKLDCKGH